MSSLLSAEMAQTIGRLEQSLWFMMYEQAAGRSYKCWIPNKCRVFNRNKQEVSLRVKPCFSPLMQHYFYISYICIYWYSFRYVRSF